MVSYPQMVQLSLSPAAKAWNNSGLKKLQVVGHGSHQVNLYKQVGGTGGDTSSSSPDSPSGLDNVKT